MAAERGRVALGGYGAGEATMSVRVCVPVLRRYDLLAKLFRSLHASVPAPGAIYIIDNGKNAARLNAALIESPVRCLVKVPERSMGVAESWNWFIANVPEERIIANDDIVFGAETLRRMAETPADLVFGYGFSCFLIRDSCIEKVGMFDEAISPGYAYWEDLDYMERVKGSTAVAANAPESGVVHGDGTDGSQTWRAGTAEEQREHWRRYDIAKANYIRKWGQLPEGCR
ncbi:MAG: hypothetical protein NUV51_09315 [Sulfuricaulis sp.]|nr:hypothetical protein [Sulfuricaulis sp.]